MKELEKMRKALEKFPFYNEEYFQSGYHVIKVVADSWNADENPPKVYIKGRRLHHGAIGITLVTSGILLKNSYVMGCGYAMMEDDIDDAQEWFDFEKGGDPIKWMSMV